MEKQNQQIVSPTSTLPGISSLLSRTWRIFKARIGTFLGIIFLPFIFIFSVALSFSPIFPKLPPFLDIPLVIIFTWIVTVVMWWSGIALLFAVKDWEGKIGIRESFKRAWHKIISYIWIYILMSFIISGGYLLLVIPGIVFSIWFSLAIYVLISENLTGFNALFRSKQLMSGYWWKVFWRYLVIQIIVVIPFLILCLILQFLNPEMGGFIGVFLQIFGSLFCVIYGFLIYEDLKKLKEKISFELPKKKTNYILFGILGGLLGFIMIFASIFVISLSGVRERAKDGKILFFMSQIRGEAEIINYDEESYSNVNCDHSKISSLCEEIFEIKGGKPIFYSSQDAYCSYIKLLEDKYYCIDNQGEAVYSDFSPENFGSCDGISFQCSSPEESKTQEKTEGLEKN